MTFVTSVLTQIVHIGLLVAAAPTAAGLIDLLDARLAGRTGPPPLQPWHDLIRLSRKAPLLIESVSVVSHYAPAVGLAATLAAAALVPSFALGMALAPLADVLVIISLLTVARVTMALAAFDSGAPGPGLAQQGASALAVMAEPVLMLALLTPGLVGGSFNLDMIISQQREGIMLPATAATLAVAALLALIIADLVSHDANADEMSGGPSLAMSLMAGWLRRLTMIDLACGVFVPAGIAAADSGPIGWAIGIAGWAAKSCAFLLAMSAARAILGRPARRDLASLLGIAAVLALLAMVVILASYGCGMTAGVA